MSTVVRILAIITLVPAALFSVATAQPETKETQAIIAFAEQFLTACADENLKVLKETMALPFFVYAPCKGGPQESVEAFRDGILRRGNGIQLPTFDHRIVITPQAYLRAIMQEPVDETEVQVHLKRLGEGVHVACLKGGKKHSRASFAVMVRMKGTGMKVVAIGIGL